MKRDDRDRLADISEAIDTIRGHVAVGRNTDERLIRDAVLYNLVIISEAVKGLSEETRAREQNVPWRQIAGLRDLLAHEYFRVDMDEIEKIVGRDLALLEAAIARLRRAGARSRPSAKELTQRIRRRTPTQRKSSSVAVIRRHRNTT